MWQQQQRSGETTAGARTFFKKIFSFKKIVSLSQICYFPGFFDRFLKMKRTYWYISDTNTCLFFSSTYYNLVDRGCDKEQQHECDSQVSITAIIAMHCAA